MPETNECLEAAMFLASHSYSVALISEEECEEECEEEDHEEDRALAA